MCLSFRIETFWGEYWYPVILSNLPPFVYIHTVGKEGDKEKSLLNQIAVSIYQLSETVTLMFLYCLFVCKFAIKYLYNWRNSQNFCP